MQIEARDEQIKRLLSSRYFLIPRFQRPYSWDKDNVQEFWDDIFVDPEDDYFLGAMVVYEHSADFLGVVDGQQRLTTITLLLCVLRDTLSRLGFSDAAEVAHAYIERKNMQNKPEFILKTETSYPFLQEVIQKWGEPEMEITPKSEEKSIQNAYDLLRRCVESVVESIQSDPTISEQNKRVEVEERLSWIRDRLLSLNVIFIELGNQNDAYLIFETLNTRGKDLNIADLVKNHLTKHLPARSASVDPVKEIWQKMFEIIDGGEVTNINTYIHHFWLSKYDYLPLKQLFKGLVKRVKKTNAKDFLDSLRRDADLYRAIFEPDHIEWAKEERILVESLKAFSLFRLKQPIPLVLSILRKYKEGRIKLGLASRALDAIEKFHFMFTAVTSQSSSGGITKMYAVTAKRLFESPDAQASADVLDELIRKLKDRMPTLAVFKPAFSEIIYTRNFTKNRNLVRYILSKLDQHFLHKPATDYDQMTIEHLVPQSESGKNMSEEVIGMLGNLILLPETLNNLVDNKPFSKKVTIFQAEKVQLFPCHEQLTDLDESLIVSITDGLAEVAYKEIWSI